LNARAATAKIAGPIRTLGIAVLTLLVAPLCSQQKRRSSAISDQLKTAQEADDKPAIIELSQRIVAIAPNDSNTWDTLAQTPTQQRGCSMGLERKTLRCVAKIISTTTRSDR